MNCNNYEREECEMEKYEEPKMEVLLQFWAEDIITASGLEPGSDTGEGEQFGKFY